MWESIALIFGLQILFFIFASIYKTDKLTDLSYGMTFVILASYLIFRNGFSPILILPIVWGLRLASYLFIRIMRMKTDLRFDGIRERFWAFAQFWLLQAISIYIISMPFLFLSTNAEMAETNWLFVGLFCIGLMIESIADYQKYVFKNQEQNKHTFIQHGLWKYSRHPNYFGEMMVWWSIYAASATQLVGWQHIAIISPIYITLLLLFGTGIPTLEKGYPTKYGQAWDRYKRKTSLLIPWFPGS